MFGYKVEFECTHYHYEHSGEQYGDWSAESEHEISRIYKEEDHPDLVSIHDLKEGDKCFVVWVQWGSGDSFGRHQGANAEAFGVFKDKAVAETFAQELRKVDVERGHTLDIEMEDGQHIIHNWLPFSGYFESVEFIEVAEISVGGYGKKRF